MANSPQTVFLLFSAVLLLFGFVIYFGLRARSHQMAKNFALTAQTVWLPLAKSEWNAENLLYGIWQDDSPMIIKMIVRNFQNVQVGKIQIHHAQTPCKTFETSEGDFEADALPKVWATVSFHRMGNDSETLCTYIRKWGAQHCFEIKGLGTLESGQRQFTLAGPKFCYRLNGKPIGIKHQIGKFGGQGRYVVLPKEIPLPIQLFILAM